MQSCAPTSISPQPPRHSGNILDTHRLGTGILEHSGHPSFNICMQMKRGHPLFPAFWKMKRGHSESECPGFLPGPSTGSTARRWARWMMMQQSKHIPKARNGMKMIKGSRLSQPPGLESALSRGSLGQLQTQFRLSVEKEPAGFGPWGLSR